MPARPMYISPVHPRPMSTRTQFGACQRIHAIARVLRKGNEECVFVTAACQSVLESMKVDAEYLQNVETWNQTKGTNISKPIKGNNSFLLLGLRREKLLEVKHEVGQSDCARNVSYSVAECVRLTSSTCLHDNG